MSATLRAPPGAAATTRSSSCSVNDTSGSMSTVIRVASAGMRFAGTGTDSATLALASPAGVGDWNSARTDTGSPRSRRTSTSRTASRE
ncbi:hypothetical protein ACFQX7_02120 [Luedemannella flava]